MIAKLANRQTSIFSVQIPAAMFFFMIVLLVLYKSYMAYLCIRCLCVNLYCSTLLIYNLHQSKELLPPLLIISL